MTDFTVKQAAALLGVSDDTVRRWAEAGRLELTGSPAHVSGVQLAEIASQVTTALADEFPATRASARNRFTGIVTKVTKDLVMAQVEIQAGPFRVVSLMSAEAATELGLEPGSLATASIKATNVVVETP